MLWLWNFINGGDSVWQRRGNECVLITMFPYWDSTSSRTFRGTSDNICKDFLLEDLGSLRDICRGIFWNKVGTYFLSSVKFLGLDALIVYCMLLITVYVLVCPFLCHYVVQVEHLYPWRGVTIGACRRLDGTVGLHLRRAHYPINCSHFHVL